MYILRLIVVHTCPQPQVACNLRLCCKNTTTSCKAQATSHKRRGSSPRRKPQAPRRKLQPVVVLQRRKPQATSLKPRGASLKLQAPCIKVLDKPSLIKFYDVKAQGLNHDKCIVRMFHVKRDLVWRQPYLVCFCCF